MVRQRDLERLADKKLEEILLDSGAVEKSKLEECARKSRATGQALEEELFRSQAITQEGLAELLSIRLQIPFLSLKNYEVSPELLEKIPKALMLKYQFVPVDQFEELTSVAIGSVPTIEMLQELQVVSKGTLALYMGLISEIQEKLKGYEPAVTQEIPESTSEVTMTPAGTDGFSLGWESIFDNADKSVRKELAKTAESVGLVTPDTIESQISQVFGGDDEDFPGQSNAEAFGETGDSEPMESPMPQAWGNQADDAGNSEAGSVLDQVFGDPKEEEEQEQEQDEFEEIVSGSSSDSAEASPVQEPAAESPAKRRGDPGTELAEMAAHLAKHPYDYDSINQYVELALEAGEVKAAVRQLTLFAWGLDQAGRDEEAVNCYEYILELDPNNREAKRRLNK